MTYQERMRLLREERQLKQSQLADLLGTSTQYYQKYESGIRPLPIERLCMLADYYQVSTDYLLGRSDNPLGGISPPKLIISE